LKKNRYEFEKLKEFDLQFISVIYIVDVKTESRGLRKISTYAIN
jgi:hypothetical protein